jgi:hypothetical protein
MTGHDRILFVIAIFSLGACHESAAEEDAIEPRDYDIAYPQEAPDGAFVEGYDEGYSQIAPGGTFVGGTPQMAPDGTFVGGTPRMAPDGSFVGSDP